MRALALTGRRCAAALAAGALLAGAGLLNAAPALASTTGNGGVVIGWQPDANDLGNLTFYNAAGHQITSGSINDSPMAAYYASDASAANFGTTPTSGSMAFTTPMNGTNSAAWNGTQGVGAPNAFPVASLPGDLAGFTGAVVKGVASDGSFNAVQISSFPNSDTSSGYANLYEVRMNVNGVTNKWYAADIQVDPVTSTWTQVFPNLTTPTVAVSSTETSPQLGGTTIHLTATLGTAETGNVQFFDGTAAVGPAQVLSNATTVSITDTPTVGSHSYTARYMPTPATQVTSAVSSAYPFTVNPNPPGQVTGLTAASGNQKLDLSWTVPVGGSAPTGYDVTYTPSGGAAATVHTGSAATTYALTGLTNGTQYSVTVAGTNAGGTGTASAPATGTPNPTVSTAPTALSAVPGNGQLALSWAAPADSGGSAITGYQVTSTPAGGSATVTATGGPGTTFTLPGLTNGTSYAVTVEAVNGIGTSASSNQVSSTPATVPTAPTGLTATAGPARLNLSWTAPSSTGGSAITGYQVTYTPDGGSAATVATNSTATSYSLSGLSDGTSYAVSVQAVNGAGTSAASSSASGTPVDVPGAPTGVAAVAQDGAAVVSFAAGSAHGSAITSYTVRASTGESVTGTSSPITVPEANGTTRTFTVTATNNVGTSPASAASNPVVYYSSALTIRPSTGTVVAGSAVKLYGQLTSGPASAQNLVLYIHPAGHAASSRLLTTSASGAWAVYLKPANNTTYQVAYAGDATHQAVTSGTVRVNARARLAITSPRSGTRTTTRTLTVAGATYPNKSGALVTLYEYRGSTAVKLMTVRVTSRGTFAFRRTFAKGTHVLQVRIGATATNAAGASGRSYLYEV